MNVIKNKYISDIISLVYFFKERKLRSDKELNSGERIPSNVGKREQAIIAWSEGNYHLANAIRQCIDNGLKTDACSPGNYEDENLPYLKILFDKSNYSKILNIFNKVFKIKGCKIGLSFDGKNNSYASIYSCTHKSDHISNYIFDTIAKSCDKELDLSQVNQNIRQLFILHCIFRSYSDKLCNPNNGYSKFILKKNKFGKKEFCIDSYSKMPLFDELNDVGFKFKGNEYNGTYRYCKSFVSGSKLNLLLRYLNLIYIGYFSKYNNCDDMLFRLLIDQKEYNDGIILNDKLLKINENYKRDKYLDIYINDIDIAIFLINKIDEITKKNSLKSYKLKSDFDNIIKFNCKLKREIIIEIADLFFKNYNIDFSELLFQKESVDNSGHPIILKFKNNINKSNCSYPKSRIDKVVIEIKQNNNLIELYDLVHEIAHSFDNKLGDTHERKILGEIVPLEFEKLLDIFLLDLTDFELKKYGLNKEKLEIDIRNIRLNKIINNYKNLSTILNYKPNFFNDKVNNILKEERAKKSKYMLAQICCDRLDNFKISTRIEKVKYLIDDINNGIALADFNKLFCGKIISSTEGKKLDYSIIDRKILIEDSLNKFMELYLKNLEYN